MNKVVMYAYCGKVSYGCEVELNPVDVECFRQAVIGQMLEDGLPIKGPVLISIPGGKA